MIKRSPWQRPCSRSAVICAALLVGACSSSDDDSSDLDATDTDVTDGVGSTDGTDSTGDGDSPANTGDTVAVDGGLDLTRFAVGAFDSSEIVDCELSDGTTGQCYQLVTSGAEKSTDTIGPFCPTTTTTSEDDAGVWLDGTTLYEADGNFILDLPNLYGDAFPPADNWIFYDADGNVSVTNTQEGCEAAARPDVDPAFQSFCVECSLDFVEDSSLTFLIPVTPATAATPGTLAPAAGVSLNGFQIASMAPVDDILSNPPIAAFDDCGGHINPTDGYHFHSATGREGCNSAGTEDDGHPSLIGYALDGYGIYGTLADDSEELDSLDSCLGTEDETYGYHYHAASPELNMHIACYTGVTAADEAADVGPGGAPGDAPPGDAPPGDQPPAGG